MDFINYTEILEKYELYLYEEERSKNTISKYIRDIKKFLDFMKEKEFNKKQIMQFKEYITLNYVPISVNSIIVAINGFLDWIGASEFKVKLLKIQKDVFSSPEKELTEREYERLICVAESNGDYKLSFIIQTICSTGIRVSELKYITVASIKSGRAKVSCKGKNRTIFLPKKLCKALSKYCFENNIVSGIVFVTKNNKAMDRSNIWKMMKRLCKQANVSENKVFPHNLRHLFARVYYKIEKDIGKLADILGHSSIDTTRIYTMETGVKHARQMDKMNLVYSKT